MSYNYKISKTVVNFLTDLLYFYIRIIYNIYKEADNMFKPVSENEERLLPVYVYGSEALANQAKMSRDAGFMLHSQLSLCYSGEGIFTDHNNISHKVKSGDIMYFTSSAPNSYKPVIKPWRMDYIVMGGYALNEFMPFLGYLKSGVIHLSDDVRDRVYKNFKKIIELNNSDKSDTHAVCSRIMYRLLCDIASCISAEKNDKTDLIMPCVDYIKSNYMNDISISYLADMINVTPTYLGIIFKKVYNITPQKFLTNIRIDRSKQLLVNYKDMPLADISAQCGFNSTSYFCNTFKKIMGITPTEYRSINTFGEI